jgi:broad-specificity NMP kinase
MRTLITGMSAVGKSSVIHELIKLGHSAVDLDTDEWSHVVADDTGYADRTSDAGVDWRWREPKVRALLSNAAQGTLFVAGTSTDQSRFYPLLDHIVLLTIPVATAKERLASRTTNDYGKDPAELRRELQLRTVVEPLLRRSSCLEIDTSMHPLSAVATMITNHVTAAYCAAASPTGQAESPRRSKPSR